MSKSQNIRIQMYGGCSMNNHDKNSYIESLINQIFCILPMFEEKGYTDDLHSKIKNMYYKIEGFLKLYDYDPIVTIDILSLLTELYHADSHQQLRFCVLRICNLLSCIKVEADNI